MLLSGILSLPWSLFSSLPPDVEVPLPLGFDPVVVPVGAALGLAELAAGSPAIEPRPLEVPSCASEKEEQPSRTLKIVTKSFMASSSVRQDQYPQGNNVPKAFGPTSECRRVEAVQIEHDS